MSRFAVCYAGTPRTPIRSSRAIARCAWAKVFCLAIARFIILPASPMTSLRPRSCNTVVSFRGFFLVRFSFSVRSRSSVRRVSVPFRRVAGLALARGCARSKASLVVRSLWLLASSKEAV